MGYQQAGNAIELMNLALLPLTCRGEELPRQFRAQKSRSPLQASAFLSVLPECFSRA
jgi:hypothetical protein